MRRSKIKMADRGPSVFFRKHLAGTCLSFLILLVTTCEGELWPLERPDGMPVIQSLEVMCGKDHMDVHLSFSHPFEGIVSSKGQHGDPRCVYVPPSTGQTFFSFRIAYARCGTKPDLHGQFYENTVVVQYDKDLLEVWDEAKRLRCEWFNDYEKTASKPPMVIADLDVIQLDFRGDNVDCWMEIQHGKGPWAPPVSGIVPLGSTLTLVVAINDFRGEFDMRVKSCAASDGAGHVIDLSDEAGCVLRPKMISRFLKAKAADDRASVITYAFFHAFKFPDALSVHIKCKVEICRHGCLEHCQLPARYAAGQIERKDEHSDRNQQSASPPENGIEGHSGNKEDGPLYDDVVQDGDEMALIGGPPPPPPPSQMQRTPTPKKEFGPQTFHSEDDLDGEESIADLLASPFGDPHPSQHENAERFPHGPRQLDELDPEDEDEAGGPLPAPLPAVAGPRKLDLDNMPPTQQSKDSDKDVDEDDSNRTAAGPDHSRRRRRRSVVVSDRRARSADVGVSGLYEVISEADLAFNPSDDDGIGGGKAEAVTVFQGRIREEVVYGICLPVPGFSALFALVAASAVASALVAGALLYRYQIQRERQQQQPQSLAAWMALRLLGAAAARTPVDTPQPPTASQQQPQQQQQSSEN